MKILILLLSLSLFSFATFGADKPFKFDVAELEENVELLEEEEEFSFSDSDLKDESVETDLSFTPEKETPKLNPNTKIISTKNGKYIYHPNQEKGLYKINRNSEYLYKFKKSPVKGFFNMKFGQINLKKYESDDKDANGNGRSFESLYDSDSITALFLEYEWEPFKKYRSLSVKAGGGVSYARGSGRFISTDGSPNPNAAAGLEAQERYNFMLWSSTLGLTYKFKIKEDQLFLPFVTGALDYNLATEFRSGFEAFKYQGILATHFGGGVSLNLGWLERAAALELDKEFGINNAYLTIEARNVIVFDDDKDIGGFIFIAGLSFEY